ncbi:MAG: FkbM family methyltransferase [Candidatus Hydrogenedentota bacterium]|nr:MAG: FkbM family methyltransferase [Candidatus Hydrogenedentota bacterium]
MERFSDKSFSDRDVSEQRRPRILVVRSCAATLLPAIDSLRNEFPDAAVDLLVSRGFRDAAGNEAANGRVIEVDRDGPFRRASLRAATRRTFRKTNYIAVVTLYPPETTAPAANLESLVRSLRVHRHLRLRRKGNSVEPLPETPAIRARTRQGRGSGRWRSSAFVELASPARSPHSFSRRLRSFYATLFNKPAFLPWNRFLFRLGLAGLGVDHCGDEKNSGEAWFVRNILRRIGKKATVVDVGAGIGRYARLVRRNASDARILCLEPHPATFRVLSAAAAEIGAEAFAVGAAETDRSAPLFDFVPTGSSRASLFPETLLSGSRLDQSRPAEGDSGEESLWHSDVPLVSLDSWLPAQEVSQIHLLKIDTEGSERLVLEGARRFLSEGRVDVIQFEFNEMNLASRTFLADIRTLLPGFQLYRILSTGLLPLDSLAPFEREIFAYQNIAAIRSALSSPDGIFNSL